MNENKLQVHLLKIPKTKRGVDTLEKISLSAEKLFGSKGYTNTTINDIATGAEVAPGTFYIYFKDKLSVFRYLVEKLEILLRKELSDAIKNSNTRFEKEQKGFKAFFQFLNRHRGLFKIIWEAQFVEPELFKNYYESIASSYTRRIKEAQDTGEIKSTIDANATVYSFLGIVNFIGLKWILFDDKPVPDNIIDDLMTIIKNGAFNS